MEALNFFKLELECNKNKLSIKFHFSRVGHSFKFRPTLNVLLNDILSIIVVILHECYFKEKMLI